MRERVTKTVQETFQHVSELYGNTSLCIVVTPNSMLKTHAHLVWVWCAACTLSRVRLFVTPWTTGPQAPLSIEFSTKEH